MSSVHAQGPALAETLGLLGVLGLIGVLAAVLVLPIVSRRIEALIEPFLLAMGAIAATLGHAWSGSLVRETLIGPLGVCGAVLAGSLLFRALRDRIASSSQAALEGLGPRAFAFALVASLGLVSGIVTSIVAALVLAEVVGHLRLDREGETRLVVISCFSIGLGSALTPLGGPLASIAVAALAGPQHAADFWFLLRLLWPYAAAGILGLSLLAAAVTPKGKPVAEGLREDREEGMGALLLRVAKVYAFVAALLLLGSGFRPLVDAYVLRLPGWALYWTNSLSAVLDNATMAAAELGPAMGSGQILSALLGLVLAGGMLIPGNLPNIISAGKLGIGGAAWAKTGIPVGLGLMAAGFAALVLIGA